MNKFPKSIISIFLLLYSINLFSQPDVITDSVQKYKKVMIIPFEETKYLCGVQRNLAEESNKTHEEIVSFFRFGLSAVLQNEFLYLYNTISLIHYSDTNRDLYNTYSSVNYRYDPFIEETEEDEHEKNKLFKGHPKSKVAQDSNSDNKIENGQIKSRRVVQQKFAKLLIKKPETFSYLNQKYGADLFLFVTEFDIENDISDPIAFINNEYERFLRAHYSIVNKKGKVISEGLVQIKMPNTVNDVEQIKKDYLPLLAKKLAEKLPVPFYKKEDPSKINKTEKLVR
jgi:hypothetical protein